MLLESATVSRTGGPGDQVGLLVVYVLIIVAFAATPLIVDLWRSYDNVAKKGDAPQGVEGLARAVMALTTILILGIAVFHVLMFGIGPAGDQTQQPQIANNILSLLGGLLAAITGFYFGSRSTQQAMTAAASQAASTGSSRGPPTDVIASTGAAPSVITVSWKPPASTGGTPVVQYVVTAYPGGRQWQVLGTETSLEVTGLTAGIPYTFTVGAQNAYGVTASDPAAPAVL